MRGGVEQKKEQKKEGLLEAAYQLFLEKGVNKTSVDEIVKKANVAKGTFICIFTINPASAAAHIPHFRACFE